MLVLTMLLIAAAPVTDRVRVKHPAPVARAARVARKARRVRKPISMSVLKPQMRGCAGDPICVTATSRSRYRLPLPRMTEPSDKDMALQEDGTRCALIGQTICQRPTRTIVRVGKSAAGVPASAVMK